jgi:hypothetical protein
VISNVVKAFSGFAQKRSMPELYKTTLKKWYHKNRNSERNESKQRVYLFCDEFTNYNDTEIGIRAILFGGRAGAPTRAGSRAGRTRARAGGRAGRTRARAGAAPAAPAPAPTTRGGGGGAAMAVMCSQLEEEERGGKWGGRWPAMAPAAAAQGRLTGRRRRRWMPDGWKEGESYLIPC